MIFGAPIGGAPVASRLGSVDKEFIVDIGGADRTGLISEDSIKISDTLAGRSTLTAEVTDKTATLTVEPGQRVHVLFHGARLFAGTVDQSNQDEPLGTSLRSIDIRGVDWNQLCDRFLIAQSYENKTVAEIVADIVNVQTPLASSEGVTIGSVDLGPVVAKAQFNYKTVTECFRDLAEVSGMTWNIDYHRVLRFFDRASFSAPFGFDGTRRKYRKLRLRKTRTQYRNVQVLRAGKTTTGTLVETFRGDSTGVAPEKRTRTFSLAYERKKIISIKRDGLLQRHGVKGLDIDNDLTVSNYAQWFTQAGSNEVSQNAAQDEANNPTLTADQVLEVTYEGQYPIIIQGQNDTEIASRQAIEGGSGAYWDMEEDEDVDGDTFATTKTNRLLAKYGRIPALVELETDETGLAPGQLMTNTFAEHGISAVQYLIDSVQTVIRRSWGSLVVRSTVKMLDGERIDGWAEFFRDLFDQGRRFVVRENEKIFIAKDLRDTFAIGDSINTAATIFVYADDPYSFWTFTNETVASSGEVVYSGRIGKTRFGKPENS